MAATTSLALDTAVKLVLFDMAGTTVDDLVDGKPVVMVAMQAAFQRLRGKALSDASVTAIRGLEKKEALKVLLIEQLGAGAPQPSSEVVDELYSAFKQELDTCLPRINQELPGASETFRALQSAGIKVCVGSGFPQSTVDTIVEVRHTFIIPSESPIQNSSSRLTPWHRRLAGMTVWSTTRLVRRPSATVGRTQ